MKNNPKNKGILYSKEQIISFKKSDETYKNKLIGINLIPNNAVKELAPYLCDKDFEYSISEICDIVDYVVINLSGFNKNGLWQYFEEDNLEILMKSIEKIRKSENEAKLKKMAKKTSQNAENSLIKINKFPAVLIKIDPDLNLEFQKKICEVAINNKADGIIIGEMYEKKQEKLGFHTFEFYENEEMKKQENKALISIYKQTKGKQNILIFFFHCLKN